MSEQRKKIVVIGGGFAGMNFVKSVCHSTEYDITLVDKHNFHQFMPLLYQVAMAFIEPSNISYPFRRMFQRQKNIHFHFGCVQSVDVASNTIQTDTGTISFDYLVIATGTVPNYFGMENVKKNSFPLKSITDATNLRNHLLMNIEEAVTTSDPEQRAALLKVVIAGGGPTGVEVAGMLAEMVRNIGPKEYPEFTTGSFRIYLIEAAPVLLGTMSEKAQQEALHTLSSLGVTIQLNTAVKDFIDGKVILSSGESIATRALVWTSGVTGGQLDGLAPDKFGRGRRLVVDEYNKVVGTDNLFAIGDISISTLDKRFPAGHPQLAQVAIQQGKNLAANFVKGIGPTPWKPFRYHDKGSLAIISKYKAVADLPKFVIKGFAAWLLWLLIHLVPIAGFRNKVTLALSWAWSLLTDDPTLRLIIRPEKPEKKKVRELV